MTVLKLDEISKKLNQTPDCLGIKDAYHDFLLHKPSSELKLELKVRMWWNTTLSPFHISTQESRITLHLGIGGVLGLGS
jgi:hypothetical protein